MAKRGDVVLVRYPNSDLLTAKIRPALIVQADGLGSGLPQTILAMITSNMARAGHPSRVIIEIESSEGQQSGLLVDSVAMTDNLATVLESAISRVVGMLPMADVEAALTFTLGMNREP